MLENDMLCPKSLVGTRSTYSFPSSSGMTTLVSILLSSSSFIFNSFHLLASPLTRALSLQPQEFKNPVLRILLFILRPPSLKAFMFSLSLSLPPSLSLSLTLSLTLSPPLSPPLSLSILQFCFYSFFYFPFSFASFSFFPPSFFTFLSFFYSRPYFSINRFLSFPFQSFFFYFLLLLFTFFFLTYSDLFSLLIR